MDTFLIRPKVEEPILQELALCRCLTIRQVRNRFFSKGSYTYVSTLLKNLAHHGYVQRLEQRQVAKPLVYQLGKRGVRYLRDGGADIKFFPSEHRQIASIHFPHLMLTNDVLIAAARVPEMTPSIQVRERRHYLTSRQQNRKAIPDAWVHFEQERLQVCVWVEVDRGTEEEAYMRNKIRTVFAFGEHGYQEEFGVDTLTIAFITTKSPNRLAQLVKWVENEINHWGEVHSYSQFFRLTYLTEGTMTPALFTEACWRTPFSLEKTRLL